MRLVAALRLVTALRPTGVIGRPANLNQLERLVVGITCVQMITLSFQPVSHDFFSNGQVVPDHAFIGVRLDRAVLVLDGLGHQLERSRQLRNTAVNLAFSQKSRALVVERKPPLRSALSDRHLTVVAAHRFVVVSGAVCHPRCVRPQCQSDQECRCQQDDQHERQRPPQ